MAQPRTSTVSLKDQARIPCVQCKRDIPVHIIPQAAPHLYCTHCNNVYHERYEEDYFRKFRLAPFRRKIMQYIEGHAPACGCNGLFLFNALPHCPYCHHQIPLPVKADSKARLLYGDMMVFNGTHEYVDHGVDRIYRFE